jgi:hypothetical protein
MERLGGGTGMSGDINIDIINGNSESLRGMFRRRSAHSSAVLALQISS